MRDLAVYYCKKCGYYAYYQLPKNAVCPNCNCKMTLMDMRYQDFMDLNHEERDRLISELIINSSASLIQRICAPAKIHNQREVIGHLTQEVATLEQENKRLNETIDWMHQTIWDQLHIIKKLKQELQELKAPKD